MPRIVRFAICSALIVVLAAVAVGGRLYMAELMARTITGVAGTNFPETGRVHVAADLPLAMVASSLTAQAASENTIVQLFDTRSGQHTLSVYVRAYQRVTIPAPIGLYDVRVIRGRGWWGSRRYFDHSTTYDAIDGPMLFTPRHGHVVDLRQGPDSNLVLRRLSNAPEPLE